ncbi:WXG100 family type VII secretion target [Streptomyces gamaensis]|uniref:WXG100 family type VII secretion target n=1 Tax=Streptomyces gamaensis TaxID=1763542 RepID=A0ABW0ZAJ9_9ACTN
MSDTQKISDHAFFKFENSIQETSEALSANLRTLVNAIATVEAAWTGAGADAFRRAQTSLNEDHNALRQLIDMIHEAVSLTRKYGHANDGDVLASFNRIDVSGASATGTGTGVGMASKIDNY